jgi:hypothetical protein
MMYKRKVKRICKERGYQLWETKDDPYITVDICSDDGWGFRLRESSIYKSWCYERLYRQLTVNENEPTKKRII